MFKKGEKLWCLDYFVGEVRRRKVIKVTDNIVWFSENFCACKEDCFSDKDEANLALVEYLLVQNRSALNATVDSMKQLVDEIRRLEKRKDKLERKLR